MSQSSSSSDGVALGALLGVLFIGLKLGKVIDWSWYWVLSPFWIPLALIGVVVVVALLAFALKKALRIATK